ncbi:hypothetical protein [Lysobacter gummosus]|jgi:hypothetical protein|uniref:Uncharacterized protein n=1 Tax=Lysobacter gummosus TaxID=262324 RepID=A0ABY3XJD4_9GAMM|nr:hypothetical protein [Lysobacter gummosus]ALN91395.1 hypothetical protein LG3211_2428 [Lysobacter gummosus]UNP31773.1 hypothetical protein MOV92_11210 [Lysobacter gummosus]
MKRSLLWLCLLCPVLAQAAWIGPDGKPIPDSSSRRSDGDFGAQLLITPDEDGFRKEWAKQPGPPSLRTTDKARVGAPISAMVLFHGCKADAQGHCRVLARFFLSRPDGSRESAGEGPVWTAAPMPAGIIQLGQSAMTLTFEPRDRPGEYQVIAQVEDSVAGRRIDLSTPLQLDPGATR